MGYELDDIGYTLYVGKEVKNSDYPFNPKKELDLSR